jgi:TRAP-type C4-dicarboxylate transport system permease small subunit
VLGGFFLLKTKSRGVAGALLLYAVITTVLFLAKILGLAGNGVPLVIALIALWAGWRGWTGTRFWQTRACAITNWSRVAAAAVLAVAITTVVLCVILAGFTGGAIPRGVVEFVLTAVLFLVPVAVLVWFTRKRAFAESDPACPWPPKRTE